MKKTGTTAQTTVTVYPQAERTAVYRGGHGKRVRRKRTDDTGRPCLVGSIRANKAHAKL